MASIDIFNRKVSVPELVAKWWEFDQVFSAKVMVGEWSRMTRKELGYAEIQVAMLAVVIAACSVADRGQSKPVEVLSTNQPTIGLITEASAGNNLLLNQQLAGVKSLSGRADCQPQLVAVDGGNLGAETVGLCQVDTKDGQGTEVVVRKQKDGVQQIIKQMLTARTSPETVYFEYGNNAEKETLFTYDVSSGETQWILPDGRTVEFAKGQSPFEKMIGQILDPGNVAQAAEATPVPDPTKPATIIATLDGKLTITQIVPTEKPPTSTPKPTKEVVPPTPIPDATEIPVSPTTASGDWRLESLNSDPCPTVSPLRGIQEVVPSPGYEYLIGQTGFVCQFHTLSDGTVQVAKEEFKYVSVLPTP